MFHHDKINTLGETQKLFFIQFIYVIGEQLFPSVPGGGEKGGGGGAL